MFYLGTTIDLFLSTKSVAIKSIISKTIPEAELGRIFSVLGIIDSLDAFIFPSLYSFVYLKTVDVFVGAIYFLSEFFFILTLIMFIAIYVLFKRNVREAEDNDDVLDIKESYKSFEVTKL
jgi:hypothetical protein